MSTDFLNINMNESSFLFAVKNKIKNTLSNQNIYSNIYSDTLYNATNYLCINDSAKKIRPLLTMLYADILQLDRENVINISAVSELIHSSSLLHDDVLDTAHIRRKNYTTNYIYGNSVAVLSGNYLLSLAISLLKNLPINLTNFAINSITKMNQAALSEIEVRGDLNITLNTWKKIAFGKTGELFSWSGKSVAYIASDPNAMNKFSTCGLHLGLAFQMADDLMDIQNHKNNKESFTDLRNKESSYPILLALQDNPKLSSDIKKIWYNKNISSTSFKNTMNQIINSGTIEKACINMLHEFDLAADSLDQYINTEGGQNILNWLSLLSQKAKVNFL